MNDIGALFVKRSYLSANEPLLLNAVDADGKNYFAVYADTTEAGLLYMLVPASEARLAAIEAGEIDIRSAVVGCEEGHVALVCWGETTPIQTRWVAADDEALWPYLAAAGIRLPVGVPHSLGYEK